MHVVFLVKSTGKDRGMSPGPPANRVWRAFSYFSAVLVKQYYNRGFIDSCGVRATCFQRWAKRFELKIFKE